MERRSLGATPPTATLDGNIAQFLPVTEQNKGLLVWIVDCNWDKDFKTVKDSLFHIINVLNLFFFSHFITLNVCLPGMLQNLPNIKLWVIREIQWKIQITSWIDRRVTGWKIFIFLYSFLSKGRPFIANSMKN